MTHTHKPAGQAELQRNDGVWVWLERDAVMCPYVPLQPYRPGGGGAPFTLGFRAEQNELSLIKGWYDGAYETSREVRPAPAFQMGVPPRDILVDNMKFIDFIKSVAQPSCTMAVRTWYTFLEAVLAEDWEDDPPEALTQSRDNLANIAKAYYPEKTTIYGVAHDSSFDRVRRLACIALVEDVDTKNGTVLYIKYVQNNPALLLSNPRYASIFQQNENVSRYVKANVDLAQMNLLSTNVMVGGVPVSAAVFLLEALKTHRPMAYQVLTPANDALAEKVYKPIGFIKAGPGTQDEKQWSRDGGAGAGSVKPRAGGGKPRGGGANGV